MMIVFTIILKEAFLNRVLMLCFVLCSAPEPAGDWMGYIGQALMATTAYLPAQMSQVRSFAQAHLPSAGLRTQCVMKRYDLILFLKV